MIQWQSLIIEIIVELNTIPSVPALSQSRDFVYKENKVLTDRFSTMNGLPFSQSPFTSSLKQSCYVIDVLSNFLLQSNAMWIPF